MSKTKTYFTIIFVVVLLLLVNGCGNENNGTTTVDIPEGLTYPEAYTRISSYITQFTDLIDESSDNYSGDWPSIFGPSGVSLSFLGDLLTISFTATFGDENTTAAGLETALFGYDNVSYTDSGNHYVLEYDAEDVPDGPIFHYGLIVDYNQNTDSGIITLYQGYHEYNSQAEFVDAIFEFVKTDNGYAIQSENGQAIFEIENKEVVSFTAAIFEGERVSPSIYENPSLVNDFFTEPMKSKVIYDGATFNYIEREVDDDLITNEIQFRYITIEYEMDGTQISETEGDWTAMYEVNFNLNHAGATGRPRSQLVPEGATATKPDDPTLEGYNFVEWYSDAMCIYGWDFDTEINSDTTIYACWIEEGDDNLFE